MAAEERGDMLGVFEANADLSAKQYRFVDFDGTSGKLNVVGTLGAKALGILQNNPTAGQTCSVSVGWPMSKIVLSGTVSQGGPIMSATDGTGVAATSAKYVQGYALADGVSGDIIGMIQMPNGLLA